MTRPFCKVVATAPTANQLLDILWPEFSKWHLKMPIEYRKMWDISATHIRNRQYDKNWFATARTSNKQENMQGFHEDNILVLIDEASGIPTPIYEVIEGILSTAEEEGKEALTLMCGNPTQTAGEFFNAFNKNKKLYSRFTISGDATTKPDKGAGHFFVSKRVSKKYCDTMGAKYGVDGAVYDVRVRGTFPKMADDVVIPLQWAEAAQFIKLPHFDKIADPIVLVMDVARFGGDETTLGLMRKGHCIGMHFWPKTSTNRCLDILKDAYFNGAYGVGTIPVSHIIVDEPGVGGGVIDVGIRDELPIIPYHGQAAMVRDKDPTSDFRMFSNRRSRDWWNIRLLMEQGKMKIPEDEELVNQLSSLKYDYVNEKIKIETKKELKERLGDDASPDRGDTIVMGGSKFLGPESFITIDDLDFEADIEYAEDRATADMDF